MNKKVTFALALTCLLAAAGAILYLMGEILFIDCGEVDFKPDKSTKTPSSFETTSSQSLFPESF